MNIDDCNDCRSEDCDACFSRRQHAKHDHCLDCRCCLIGEERSDNDGDRCMRCVPCTKECGCDSEYQHAMAEDESRRDFLLHYAGSDAAGKPMSAEEWARLRSVRR